MQCEDEVHDLQQPWDVVVVTFNSRQDLEDNWCHRNFPDWVNVIVVDNGSSDDSVNVALGAGLQVVRSTNVGLATSNNRGALSGNSDYIAFCNPDVKLNATDLEVLRGELDSGGGLVAPRLCHQDGSKQPNGRSWPTALRILANRIAPNSKLAQDYLWPSSPDWLTGAFICTSRKTFERYAKWNPNYFLYFEDVELCARMTKAGIPVAICEKVIVAHSWRRESANILKSTSRLHVRSALRFYAQYPKRIFM
ncbi:glycosyltransferase family 2 protein [Rhodococcus fascians]|nr:glycosyltransferase family 2 protein [Rhodococcus fascians]